MNTYERLLPIFLKPPVWTVGSLPHVSLGKPFIKPFSLKEAAEPGQGGRRGGGCRAGVPPGGERWPWGLGLRCWDEGDFPAVFPAAVPSHPYGITLLNCDGHSMILGWKVPKFSGGSPILGYYIDKREAHHKNWHEVNSSPLKERILKVGARGLSPSCQATSPRARSPPSSVSEFSDVREFDTEAKMNENNSV